MASDPPPMTPASIETSRLLALEERRIAERQIGRPISDDGIILRPFHAQTSAAHPARQES